MEPRSSRHSHKSPRDTNRSGFKVVYAVIPALLLVIGIILWQTNDMHGLFGSGGDKGSKDPLPTAQAGATSTPLPSVSVEPSPVATSTSVPSPEPSAVAAPVQGGTDKPITMSFVGDIMMSDKVEGILQKNGYDYPYTFVKSYFGQADLSIANLETPITTGGTKQDKEYSYQSSPLALPPMVEAGIDLVNLANNHSMDRGPDGLMDTIRHLDTNSVSHVGAGANIDEAYKPAIIEKNGMKVAFFGFSHVVPEGSWKATKNTIGTTQLYDPTLALESVQKVRPNVDVVVVLTHWGVERADQPKDEQRGLAHKFIDAGADLIIGSHPHVVQGFEQYKGKWIAYSLGNFIFTTNSYPETWNSMILQASCEKGGACGLKVVPVLTTYAKPEPMKEPKAGKLLEHLTQISYGAKVDSNGQVTAVKP